MEQEGFIGAAVSPSPRPFGGYPTVGYSYHPLHLVPLPDSSLHCQPRNLLPSTPSNSPSDSGNEGQPLPSPSPINAFFRPVDFDNPRAAANADSTIGYPPTPTDSEGDGSESAGSPTGGISVMLEDEDLWKSFGAVGNEMIVTKPGRRLFPSVMVSVRGLNPRAEYTVSLRARSADKYRYKFLNLQWVPLGESEVLQNEEKQIFKHPSSANSGEFWMKKPISFKTVKVTHNTTSKHGNLLLYTMHKYHLELVVAPAGMDMPFKIKIPETTFMAVTSYQNIRLTQLKIDNNPFAKGFRDRDLAILPPAGYNRPNLPLWQMPHLSCPVPCTSLPPAYLPDSYSPVPNRGSPDFTSDRSSPLQSRASNARPPMLSYPLPFIGTSLPLTYLPDSYSPVQDRGSPDFTSDRSSPLQSRARPQMLSYPLPYPCMPWTYGPLPAINSSPYTDPNIVGDEH